jgi:RecB family endonuclease NucS
LQGTGLKLIARQFRIGSYIFDLLFEDRHNGKLIVELQRGVLDRNHCNKIFDYLDEFRSQNPKEFIDVIIVANEITSERKKMLSAKGVKYREIPEQSFNEKKTINWIILMS